MPQAPSHASWRKPPTSKYQQHPHFSHPFRLLHARPKLTLDLCVCIHGRFVNILPGCCKYGGSTSRLCGAVERREEGYLSVCWQDALYRRRLGWCRAGRANGKERWIGRGRTVFRVRAGLWLVREARSRRSGSRAATQTATINEQGKSPDWSHGWRCGYQKAVGGGSSVET